MHRLPGLLVLVSIVGLLLSGGGDAAIPDSVSSHRRVLDVFGFEAWEEVALGDAAHAPRSGPPCSRPMETPGA